MGGYHEPSYKGYRSNYGILGGWDTTTGKATGLGAVEKWTARWAPLTPKDLKQASGVDHDAWLAEQRLKGAKEKADRSAVDLSDQQARQVAMAARRRQGRGLSSTFVSGRGGGTLLGGG